MGNKQKVCIVTGTRAEYGLLYFLLKEIEMAADMQLQIIVTGAHLSPEFGLTYKQIEKDGFYIDHKVEMLLSSDSESSIAKSMGLAMIGFSDAFDDLNPDVLIVLGDRFEIFSAVSAATIARIPVAHLHGGETTEGAFDESFRHSITKMSHLHFTSTPEYRNRVIQLGENPDRVFNVGAIGIDNIKKLDLLSRNSLEKSIGFSFGKRSLLITFHPVTLEDSTAEVQFKSLLEALDSLEDTNLLFTKSNADTGGRIINSMIDDYVSLNSDNSVSYASLGQLRYLSAMQYVSGVIGNSSSGLLEAPSFKIGTINIGDRQRGRINAESIINCDPTTDKIVNALNVLFSQDFQAGIKNIINPYGDGNTVKKIMDVMRRYSLQDILKKKFYDL